ncbi:MAG TPA: asparagine synthase-related protein [Thermoleophilia bacterium]|nr:asparagine synthase-related protein [Thermoleophilia bacterium]
MLFETDWLASEPVFYNTLSGLASTDINDVIDLANLEFSREGLACFLEFGFCAFGLTPVRDVAYLPPSSRLLRSPEGRLEVESLPDGLEQRLSDGRSEDEVIDLLRSKVARLEESAVGDIVIPTSGGYDSRLLNLVVGDRTRVRAFTYGTSSRQSESIEVTRARELSRRLGVRWEQIPLGLFHIYFDDWDHLFGPAVHAHGMYQMEFLNEVNRRVGAGRVLLSGLAGDWFSGKGDPLARPVACPSDVPNLIMRLGLHADARMSHWGPPSLAYESYYEQHREVLRSHRRRLVEMVRFRLMLLHYLLKLPRHLGFEVVAPFTDIDVAAAIMSLPDERRVDRRWVREYFEERGAALDEVSGSGQNSLNYQGMRLVPLPALDEQLLREIVRSDYVRWVNRHTRRTGEWAEFYTWLAHRKGFRRAIGRAKGIGLWPRRRLEAYGAYLTLRPLESLLKRRDMARATN